MYKRIFAFLMAACLILCISGCSSSGESSSSQTKESSSAESVTESSSEESSEESTEESTDSSTTSSISEPSTDKSATIIVLYPTQSIDMNSDYVSTLIEEVSGYHTEYQYYSDDNQLAATVASGTDANLIYLGTGMYQTLLSQGALKNIKDAYDAYPELYDELFEPGIEYVTGEDGGLYGIPMSNDAVYAGGMFYRTDIFADNGYEEPNTIDEFYTLLQSIKSDTGLIPLTGSSPWQPVIASAFGLSYPITQDASTGEVTHYLYNDNLKEYLRWMANAYAEGLIDADLPVNTSSVVDEKMSSGEAVITAGSHWNAVPWVSALTSAGDEDAYFKTIIELEDANGDRHIATSVGLGAVFAMPINLSDEDALYTMGMVATRLDYDNYWIFNVGYEGETYTLDEDGVPHPIQPAFGEEFMNAHLFQIGRNQYAHPISWMCRVQKTQVQWDSFYDANVKASAYPFEGNPLAFANFPAYAEYDAALDTLCLDYFTQVIAGQESLDNYDSFVAEWEASGGTELLEGAQEWVDANPELAKAGRESFSPYAEIFGYTYE